ncbi:MAG: lytic transglycosylase domain-containing protein [Actinomycetota bacterium]
MKRLVVAIVAVIVLFVVALGIAATWLLGGGPAPSERAQREIPADLIPLYQSAASTCEGMDWTVLAAVHRTETDFGRGAAVSSAGARGPMQFMAATWASYGIDGDRDGLIRINDLEDSVVSAANLLCANGAGDPATLAAALFNYNHSPSYVSDVTELAANYGVVQLPAGSAAAQANPEAVLGNRRLLLSESARRDIELGLIDARVLAVLELASQRFTLGVSVMKTGHSAYVDGTSDLSNHFFGEAVDIYAVNGLEVGPLNPHAQSLALFLSQLPDDLRPTEIGSPFSPLFVAGAFTDEAHQDHVHFGFD